jgi:hypothetical protein
MASRPGSRLALALAPALVCASACGRDAARGQPRVPSSASPSSSGGSPAAPDASSAPAGSASAAAFELDRGCAQDLDASVEPRALLSALGATCAPGMISLGASAAGAPGVDGATATVAVALRDGACVRAGAVAEPRGSPMQLRLVRADGTLVASAREAVTPMLLGRGGPVCVRTGGPHRLEARPLAAPARVWVQAWASGSASAGAAPSARP